MAIYDVDAINEQNEVVDTETVLDNMLEACCSMMDMLEATAGGARGRHLKLLADKQDKAAKKMDFASDAASYTISGKAKQDYSDKAKEARDEYDEYADKASHYSARVGRETGMTEKPDYRDYDSDRSDAKRSKDPDAANKELDGRRSISRATKEDKGSKQYGADFGEYNRYHTGSYRHDIKELDKNAKENWKRSLGLDRQKDDPMASKKPGQVLELQKKKRAIKETCLNILSVIDEL